MMTNQIKKYDEVIFEVDEYTVHIYFEKNSSISQQIDEAKHRGNISLGGQYSANQHAVRVTSGEKHLHIYAGQKQIAAVNFDGTGHDGYSGVKLPNKVANAISKIFPSFRLPLNNIIESATTAVELLLKMQFQ